MFTFSVWLLTMLFCAVVGSWYGGWAAVGLPLAAGVLCLAAIGIASMPWPRRAGPDIRIDGQQTWINALCEGLAAPSLTLDSGVVEVANQAFLALLDYRGRGDQVLGMPFTQLLHPIDHAAFARMLAACGDNAAAAGVLRLVRADGRLLKSQASISPLQGAPGRLLVQLDPGVSSSDSPARTEELARVLDQLEPALFQTDREGRIGYVNRAWERLSGRSAAQSRGLQLVSVVHPEDRPSIETPLQAMGRRETDELSVEFRMVAANGSFVWVALRARANTLAEGDFVGIGGTVTEITRRKQLEATLGSTRRHLNTLLANVPGMVYRGRNDPDWTMDFVSDGCLDLTGYEPYELVEKGRVTFGSLIHPQDREFVWTQVQRQLAQHKPYHISYRITDAQGQLRWVWEQGRGVFSAHGELLAIEGFITDVSARQGAEEQARRRMWFEARTGMLSRALFDSLLAYVWQHAQLVGYPYALFVIDLIGMPALLETFGAEKGERALDRIAQRFSAANSPGAAVSYLGAHQFAVLLSDFRAGGVVHALAETREVIPAASAIASRLAQALSTPFRLGDEQHAIDVVIGIALGHTRYVGGEAMLQAARDAAAQAAALGPGHCEFADQ